MSAKYEVLLIFKSFRVIVEKQFDSSIKIFYFDNSDKFLKLKSFVAENGVKWRLIHLNKMVLSKGVITKLLKMI